MNYHNDFPLNLLHQNITLSTPNNIERNLHFSVCIAPLVFRFCLISYVRIILPSQKIPILISFYDSREDFDVLDYKSVIILSQPKYVTFVYNNNSIKWLFVLTYFFCCWFPITNIRSVKRNTIWTIYLVLKVALKVLELCYILCWL